MSIVSVIVGVVLIAVFFGLMVWGQKYLGEEAGRNPKGNDNEGTDDVIENPCKNCGTCDEKNAAGK